MWWYLEMCAQKVMWAQRHGGHLQVRKRVSVFLAPWSCTSCFQNCEQINLCCLNHLVYGILLWQPKLTNTLLNLFGSSFCVNHTTEADPDNCARSGPGFKPLLPCPCSEECHDQTAKALFYVSWLLSEHSFLSFSNSSFYPFCLINADIFINVLAFI